MWKEKGKKRQQKSDGRLKSWKKQTNEGGKREEEIQAI